MGQCNEETILALWVNEKNKLEEGEEFLQG